MAARPRLVFVAGARPNFMKVAPILRAFEPHADRVRCELVHTGQHYDAEMSDIFFSELGIPAPAAHLDVGSATHGVQTARVLAGFEEHLLRTTPAPVGVVVVGDVNSTMACALAAVKLGIPVAHVEAGLRSFDRTMPEEINRIVTDAIANLLLVSEPVGEQNLRREGIPQDRIHYVGNVMIDTIVRELPAARQLAMPRRLGLEPGAYAFVTLHRPGNVDDPARLAAIVGLLEQLGSRLPVVLPAHPRTRQRLERFGLLARLLADPALRLLPPLGYHESLGLMAEARVVVTDSGGIQDETSFLGVPCLTLRPNTERPATVTLGTNTILDGNLQEAVDRVDEICAGQYKRGSCIPGWDGRAAQRVVEVLVRCWAV